MFRVLLSVVALTNIQSSSAFLLEGKCLLGPPCECVVNTITCSRQNLSTIPAFTAAIEHYNTIAVTFNFNRLTNVPARAFSNLGTTGALSIDIKLAWNQITSVDQDAFEGIERAVTKLDLSDNKLTSPPAALKKLSALRELFIDGNPLTSLPGTVMSAIGGRLNSFSTSLDLFNAWPSQMQYFTTLRDLTVIGLGTTEIPKNAFDGFSSSLQTLTLQSTMLGNIPSAICTLQNTKTFTFSFNYFMNKTSGFPCEQNSTVPRSITTLTISDDNLIGFPDMLSLFPSVTRVSLSNNHISNIYNHPGLEKYLFTEIDFTNNSFVTVPSAFNRFKKVTVLRLDHNLISRIGANDFSGMTHIKLLYLTNNPIQSIDSQAFMHNQQITILDLSKTPLTSVPTAVTALPNLSIFHLSDDQIECSCVAMVSLKNWNASKVHSTIGTCKASSGTIKDFVRNDLQKC